LRHLKQTRKNNCGQTCVAMVTGLRVESAERWCGTTGLTSSEDLRAALFRAGWHLGRAQRVPKYREWEWTRESGKLLLYVKICPEPVGSHHWAVWDGKTELVYDPGYKLPKDVYAYKKVLDYYGGRVTSFAPIWKTGSMV
jgi:hypothetical protein